MEISYFNSSVKAKAWENTREIITMDIAGIEEIHFWEKDDSIPGLDTKVRVGSLIWIRSDVRKIQIAKRMTKSQIENTQIVLEFETDQDMHNFRAAVEDDYNKEILSVQPEDVEVIAPWLISDSMKQQRSISKTPTKLSRKDRARKHVCQNFITSLFHAFRKNEHWNLNPKSFDQNDDENPPNPLANVEFDPKTRRYAIRDNSFHQKTPKKKKRKVVANENEKEKMSGQNDDDAIAQAMVVYLLYRLERGWGNPRSFKALSVWNGKPHNDDDEDFPLENLWEQDISEWIAAKRLGPTTLGHFDNWDSFPRFYAFADGRWARRNHTYKNQLHIISEQSCIQLAKHLSEDYAILASQIIHFILQDDFKREDRRQLAKSLYQSARKESDNFPRIALANLFESS